MLCGKPRYRKCSHSLKQAASAVFLATARSPTAIDEAFRRLPDRARALTPLGLSIPTHQLHSCSSSSSSSSSSLTNNPRVSRRASFHRSERELRSQEASSGQTFHRRTTRRFAVDPLTVDIAPLSRSHYLGYWTFSVASSYERWWSFI